MASPTVPVEPVRVGDRYVQMDGSKVTITAVTPHHVEYSMLMLDRSTWSARMPLPLPEDWTKAGSGPVPEQEKTYCLDHPLREVEPGLDYCFECVDARAADWSQVNPDTAKASLRLLRRRRDERK
jgi:hypothetical protein